MSNDVRLVYTREAFIALLLLGATLRRRETYHLPIFLAFVLSIPLFIKKPG